MTRSISAGLTLAIVAVSLLFTIPDAQAQSRVDDDGLRPYSALVVQERQFINRHEITASVGLLPLDAFTRGLTVSGGYTLHFSQLVAWEIAQFHYSFQFDTRLKDQLDALDIQPSPFEVLDYYLTSNLVLKPLYWKGSWLNDSLVRGELLLTAGGAYGWFTRSTRPGLTLGTGFRLFFNDWFSTRLDVRYMMFPDSQFFEDFSYLDELSVTLGISLGF